VGGAQEMYSLCLTERPLRRRNIGSQFEHGHHGVCYRDLTSIECK
jgi:hypothetical protein